jgi:hypothetical protein
MSRRTEDEEDRGWCAALRHGIVAEALLLKVSQDEYPAYSEAQRPTSIAPRR